MRSFLKSLGIFFLLNFINYNVAAQVSLFEFEEIIIQPSGESHVKDFVIFEDILLFSAKDLST